MFGYFGEKERWFLGTFYWYGAAVAKMGNPLRELTKLFSLSMCV